LSIQLRETDPKEAIARLDAAMLELGERHARVNEILGRELRAVLGRSASVSSLSTATRPPGVGSSSAGGQVRE
jgi:hypothetical protein